MSEVKGGAEKKNKRNRACTSCIAKLYFQCVVHFEYMVKSRKQILVVASDMLKSCVNVLKNQLCKKKADRTADASDQNHV